MARLIVISGPSGAGKDTLIKEVHPRFQNIVVSVSATTRSRRAGELEGRDYYFLPREEFLRRVEEGAFLEWAEYGGNFNGTPVDFVKAALGVGLDVILEIEVKGARQVMERYPDAVGVFIAPPDMSVLELRLRNRKTETEDSIRRRMKHAHEEMDAHRRDQQRGERYFDYAIVNDDLEQASEELCSVIQDIRAHDPAR